MYWNKLIDKWVIDKWVIDLQDRTDTLMTCPYERLVQDPVATLSEAITFMTDEEVDLDLLRREITQVDIRPRDRCAGFHFFDKGLFREIEEVAGARLTTLAIPSFEDGV